MKKILTFALCLAAAGSISAQKQVVDQANTVSYTHLTLPTTERV